MTRLTIVLLVLGMAAAWVFSILGLIWQDQRVFEIAIGAFIGHTVGALCVTCFSRDPSL